MTCSAQCVAHEVEFLQFIPGCGQDVPGERSPWRGTLLNDATIGILDPYAVWREVPGSRLATERRDRDNRPVSLDTQCHVAQTVVWSKNLNGLRWHNLRFPRFSSNRFR